MRVEYGEIPHRLQEYRKYMSKNQEEMGSLSTLVREGDTLSIRGVGKFRLEGPDFARETKKHRLRLPVKKYI